MELFSFRIMADKTEVSKTETAEDAAKVSEGGNKNLTFSDDFLYEFEGVPLHRFVNPEDHINNIKNLELEKDDVMVCGYPKSGNPYYFN